MARRFFVCLLTFFASTVAHTEAQQPANIPRIGYLSSAPASDISFRMEPFRQGLRALGYVEGKSIIIEYRSAEGQPNRLPALAKELVDLKVDIIVSAGPINTRSAKNATTTIPIVMTQDSDPVANGFIASLARPGANITGLATLAPELSGKRLEILKEIIPRLARAVTLGLSIIPGYKQALMEINLAAQGLDVEIQNLDTKGAQGVEAAITAARRGRAQAILVLNSPPHIETRIAQLAAIERLPAIYFNSAVVEHGGLMSYGASLADLDRRAATYVDKILKGAKPADLPVEQPKKFEFIVNLKAAKQTGLTIPPNVLARADRVIK